MGCLVKLLCQPERVKVSYWFSEGENRLRKMTMVWCKQYWPSNSCSFSQYVHSDGNGDHSINSKLGVILSWLLEARGVREPFGTQWAFPSFRAKILFYFLLYFIAFFLMLFSFKDSIPRQDYDTSPAVVSGRKILIPLRFDWRGKMEVAWFSSKLFKAVILKRGRRGLFRTFKFQFGRQHIVPKNDI